MSAEEKNKTLVHEFFEEAWVKDNVAAVDEFMAAEYVEHPRPSTLPPDTEGSKQLGRRLHRHQLRSRRTTQEPQKKHRLTSGVARPAGRRE